MQVILAIQDQIQRKSKRKTKINTQRVKPTYGGALRAPLAGSPACVFVFVFVLIYVELEFSPRPSPDSKAWKKNTKKKRSVAKMKVQVMTINSVQKSSKSELSSGIFDHF